MASENRQPPSPSPNILHPSSLFKDISNFKTPNPKSFPPSTTFQPPTTPNFFTASSKQLLTTPSPSLSRARRRPSAATTATSRKLKKFQLEMSQSSRKEEAKKERSIKSLARSLTVWMNFLFENPSSCGCEDTVGGGGASGGGGWKVGKRENALVEKCGGNWRLPKRQKEDGGFSVDRDVSSSSKRKFGGLCKSLRDVCSFDDLEARMREYLSFQDCMEVFTVMSNVTKNIDAGRLKMKAHCPIVTDVGMKEKATKLLMCYNPVWLQIGLYIIFGGDSLLPKEDSNREEDIAFLKMLFEKQFFSHAGLAKDYAYNKLVDGLYRPGYFENLGNVILKRFLLLVLILDRGKCQSSLPTKYGIDGLDGGSPLLFNVKSNIKSSRQMINEFLSNEVMHGEGNLIAHLVIVGYKVSYQQNPLIEYDFRITDLFQDIQDGVRLCRAIQLLQHDSSILLKLVLPSDSNKKKVTNCRTALQYLKQAGVPLVDDDGMEIVGEDVAIGDKELVLSLLWNVFIHLQLPRLITKKVLSEEISTVCRAHTQHMDIDTSTHLDLLLVWMKGRNISTREENLIILPSFLFTCTRKTTFLLTTCRFQAICGNYDVEMESPTSLVDGQAMWCLLDFYFRKELHCPCSIKDLNDTSEESIVSMRDTTDAVHNFVLSQKLTTLLGNFPEVLQICDILEHNSACNDKSVVILLVFLSSQLLVKKSKDKLNFHKLMGCPCQNPGRKRWSMPSDSPCHKGRGQSTEDGAMKFKAVQAWWQEMAKRNNYGINQPTSFTILPSSVDNGCFENDKVNAVVIIQSHLRQLVERKRYLKTKQAVVKIQLAWKQFLASEYWKARCAAATKIQSHIRGRILRKRFVNQKQAALKIQKFLRSWQYLRECTEHSMTTKSAIIVQSRFWATSLARWQACQQRKSATIIQRHVRGWILRRRFLNQKQAALKIQTALRSLRYARDLKERSMKAKSSIIVQSHIRGWIARREACQQRNCILVVQGRSFSVSGDRSYFRRWLARRNYLRQKEAAFKIQNAFRVMMCRYEFHCYRNCATEIQRFIRGQISRNRLLGSSSLCAHASCYNIPTLGLRLYSIELSIVLYAIVKLQRWWRRALEFKLRQEAAIVIQSYMRGSNCRSKVDKKRNQAVVIQAHWKGYLARKHAKEQLVDLRFRIQKSAANLEDGMRIINRLIAALKELKSMKNVSGILHNCATLDMATTHSQKCCERLVEEGAIGILLYQITAVTRSIPDQQVLKHCLSTLRNLSRYGHLADALIDHRGSIEIIFRELLRNKEEGYFIACELLRKLCTRPTGITALRGLSSLLKRLQILVEELTRKVNHEKRSTRGVPARDTTEQRLRKAIELLDVIKHGVSQFKDQ